MICFLWDWIWGRSGILARWRWWSESIGGSFGSDDPEHAGAASGADAAGDSVCKGGEPGERNYAASGLSRGAGWWWMLRGWGLRWWRCCGRFGRRAG